MDDLLRDLVARGLKGRTVSLVDNGSWAPTAAKQMREILSALKDTVFTEKQINVRSAADNTVYSDVDALVEEIIGLLG
jgi:flavorubredoxin